jgi:parallel beta-helix repeat protein
MNLQLAAKRLTGITFIALALAACTPPNGKGTSTSTSTSTQTNTVTSTSTSTSTHTALQACSFNGSSLASGAAVTAFQAAHVPFGQQCVSQQRVCTNGVLSGSFAFPSCIVDPQIVTGALYVAPNGNDSNNGSISSPFKTIDAASAAAKPGNTVYVRAGTYTGNVRVQANGSAAQPITIKPYPNEKVLLSGAGSQAGQEFVMIESSSYVVFSGFEISSSADTGLAVFDSHHVTVSNNVVHDSYTQGILLESSVIQNSHDNSIVGNTVYHNVLQNAPVGKPNVIWAEGITASDSMNSLIIGNTVYENYGEGIGALRSSNTQIIGNVARDNYSVNIYLDNAPGTLVDRNLVYATGNPNFLMKGSQRSIGIAAAIEQYSNFTPMKLSSVIVRNNIAIGNRYGFYYGAYDYAYGMQNAVVANNTFVNNTDANIHIDASATHSGNLLANNISVTLAGVPQTDSNGTVTGWSYDHNAWFGGGADFAAGAGDVNANPLFAGAAGSFDTAAYQLQPASPCKTAGRALSQVPDNFLGAARTIPFSQGAY